MPPPPPPPPPLPPSITPRTHHSDVTQADLSNGVKIMWDGRTRVYVIAPSSLRGHTQGLCGTFDNNQNNDLMTRENIVETNANRFGNSWKTRPDCGDVPDVLPPSPCETNAQRKVQAKQMCDMLLSDTFKRELGDSGVTVLITSCLDVYLNPDPMASCVYCYSPQSLSCG